MYTDYLHNKSVNMSLYTGRMDDVLAILMRFEINNSNHDVVYLL